MTLTKDILIETIKEKVGFQAPEAKDILETILEEIKQSLEKGDEVKISGFGKWSVADKKSRVGRNPHTKEPMEISARKVVSFSASPKLRAMVNKNLLDS